MASETGAPAAPWMLKPPLLTSDFTMQREAREGRDMLVCPVGKPVLFYDARCLDDLRVMRAIG